MNVAVCALRILLVWRSRQEELIPCNNVYCCVGDVPSQMFSLIVRVSLIVLFSLRHITLIMLCL